MLVLAALRLTYRESNPGIEGLKVRTPDPQFNSMMNMWSPFNGLMTYSWSRMASLIYSGERDRCTTHSRPYKKDDNAHVEHRSWCRSRLPDEIGLDFCVTWKPLTRKYAVCA